MSLVQWVPLTPEFGISLGSCGWVYLYLCSPSVSINPFLPRELDSFYSLFGSHLWRTSFLLKPLTTCYKRPPNTTLKHGVPADCAPRRHDGNLCVLPQHSSRLTACAHPTALSRVISLLLTDRVPSLRSAQSVYVGLVFTPNRPNNIFPELHCFLAPEGVGFPDQNLGMVPTQGDKETASWMS